MKVEASDSRQYQSNILYSEKTGNNYQITYCSEVAITGHPENKFFIDAFVDSDTRENLLESLNRIIKNSSLQQTKRYNPLTGDDKIEDSYYLYQCKDGLNELHLRIYLNGDGKSKIISINFGDFYNMDVYSFINPEDGVNCEIKLYGNMGDYRSIDAPEQLKYCFDFIIENSN